MTRLRQKPRAAAATALAAAMLALIVVLMSTLESTQEKSRRLDKQGSQAFDRKGLSITKRSANVDVLSASVMEDPNGAAVAVRIKNTSGRAVAGVPIAIEVKDRAGATVFKNDEAGLELSLTSAPVLAPGDERIWVHDQIYPEGGTPAKAAAEVGEEAADNPAAVPRIEITKPAFEDDPSGLAARGYVYNRSKVEQRNLVIFASASRGGRVVAAGRGQIQRLKAGRRARYTIFFIGNPRKGKLELWAPPSVLK